MAEGCIRGINSAETLYGREKVDPHAWATPKEAVVLFVTTKRRSCPLMPQFACRAAGQSMGMGLMTVSSEQGPTTVMTSCDSPPSSRHNYSGSW